MAFRNSLVALDTFLNKRDRLLFALVALAQLSVLFVVPQIITVDGPAHGYNARLMVELWNNPDGFLAGYYSFNSLSPNWSGHLISAGLSRLVTMAMAEKLIVGFVVLGLPYSFRYALKALGAPLWTSYFIFPFAHSYFLYWGLYNFCIALVLLFFLLGYWVKFERSKKFDYVLLWFLITALCVTHLFVFSAFCLLILLYEISWLLTRDNPFNGSQAIKRNAGHLLALSGGLALLGNFLLSGNERPETAIYVYKNALQLLSGLINVVPAKALDYGFENHLWRPLSILWAYLLAIGVLRAIKSIRAVGVDNKKVGIYFSLMSTLTFLVLYISTPKNDGYSLGLINDRFLNIYFLLSFILIAFTQIPKWIRSSALVLTVLFSMTATVRYARIQRSYNTDLNALNEILPFIENDKTVYPFIQSDERLHGHFSNFLGYKKRLVLLENYEAYLPYFPLKWNIEMPQLHIAGLESTEQCIKIPRWKKGPKQPVDYVVIFNGENPKFSDTCEAMLQKHVNTEYSLIKESKNGIATLYKRN